MACHLSPETGRVIPLLSLQISRFPLCHPDGAVFWRRRTCATLPTVLMRPEIAQVLRPAKSAGHQDDTAVDYIKNETDLMVSLLRAVMVPRQNNLYHTSRSGRPVADFDGPGVRLRNLTA